MTRVISYVDGFNLYFGLKSKGWKRHYWLDLVALSHDLLKADQTLRACYFFTARLRDNGRNQADKQRQDDYLDALASCRECTFSTAIFWRKHGGAKCVARPGPTTKRK